MARKAYGALLLLVILSLFAVGAWVQSHLHGCEHTWANPASQQGGRIVSSRGQFFVQRCDLKPNPVAMDSPIVKKETKAEMPQGFLVGSNTEGERAVITIGDFPIPFAWPETGKFIGWSSHTEFNSHFNSGPDGDVKGNWWHAGWHEWVIAYWLVTLLLILLPLSAGIRRLFRLRKRASGANPGIAG